VITTVSKDGVLCAHKAGETAAQAKPATQGREVFFMFAIRTNRNSNSNELRGA
jgi:hypothetical protein